MCVCTYMCVILLIFHSTLTGMCEFINYGWNVSQRRSWIIAASAACQSNCCSGQQLDHYTQAAEPHTVGVLLLLQLQLLRCYWNEMIWFCVTWHCAKVLSQLAFPYSLLPRSQIVLWSWGIVFQDFWILLKFFSFVALLLFHSFFVIKTLNTDIWIT